MRRRPEEFPAVRRYTRDDFVSRVWRYRSGEHVTILGPTKSGKTHLAYQLLERTASPEIPAMVMVMKPRDKTTRKFMKGVVHREVTSWPQPPSIWRPHKPPFWIVWPRHAFDPDIDAYAHYQVFRSLILDSYKRGKRILFADETRSLERELGLSRELVTVWTKGRSMECGLWAASQVPKFISTEAYSQVEHVFLANIPDQRDQERFGEISGVDPYLVRHVVQQLKRHEWLYIRQEDRTMCIVDR